MEWKSVRDIQGLRMKVLWSYAINCMAQKNSRIKFYSILINWEKYLCTKTTLALALGVKIWYGISIAISIVLALAAALAYLNSINSMDSKYTNYIAISLALLFA